MARPDFTKKWASSRPSIPEIASPDYAQGFANYLGAIPPSTDDHDYIMNLQDERAVWLDENKAPLASPAFTGTPTAPTAAPGTSNTQVATTAFVALAGNLLNTTRIDVASAATVNLTSSAPNTRHINITGTTSITAFTVAAGQLYFVRFAGVLTLTNNASIVTQSGANITTAAGDTCILRATAANVVEVLCYTSGVVTGTGSNVLSASPALTGNPTAPTAAQFDNDTSLATTEFVQRALGSNSGSIASTASLALTGAHAGKVINCYSTAQTLTLPAASSVPMGTCFYIFNSVDVTINAAGADLVYTGGFSQSSLLVKAGDCVVLSQFTNSQWLAIGGAAGLKNSASFGSSLAASGYQRLPSGLIIQWGSFSVGVTSYSFPIAFPTAFVSISQMQGGETSGTIGRIALASTPTTSGFTTSSVVSNKLPAYWIAIGY